MMTVRMRRTRARDNKSKDNNDNTTIKKKMSMGDPTNFPPLH